MATVKYVVLMADRSHMPESSRIPGLLCDEDLRNGHTDVGQ